jgi:hypothetical protein
MHLKSLSMATLALASLVAVTPAFAQIVESEPNNSKATANVASGLTSGATITGNSTGSSTTVTGPTSADYFRVSTAAAPLGIYRHRLTLTTTGAAGHTGTIRGLTQTAGAVNAGTDAGFQTSSSTTTPARFNQWYGFGKAEELFYRVAGTTTTTSDYTATLETTTVTPTDLGSITPSSANASFTISSLGQTTVDTELFLYDSNFNVISLNDDEPSPGTSFQSIITTNLGYGTYYVAASNFNTANNQPNPTATDRSVSSSLVDFPNILVNSSTTTGSDIDFTITTAGGTTLTTGGTAIKAGAFDINFYRFSVVPAPSSVAVFALGGMVPAFALLRRRARK